jgi:acid-sensing ion channel 2
VLRVAWDGTITLDACSQCCMRWFITVDGEECTDPTTIDATIAQDLNRQAYSLHRPASIVGICRSSSTTREPFEEGGHSVELKVGACQDTPDGGPEAPPRSGTVTGINSVSRFIVEEIPDTRSDCDDA